VKLRKPLEGFWNEKTLFIIMRQAWKMYFEVSGVSIYKLGGMRDKQKFQRDVESGESRGFGMRAACVQFN